MHLLLMACSSKLLLMIYLVFVFNLLIFRNLACHIQQSAVNSAINVYNLYPTYMSLLLPISLVSHCGQLNSMFFIAFTAYLITQRPTTQCNQISGALIFMYQCDVSSFRHITFSTIPLFPLLPSAFTKTSRSHCLRIFKAVKFPHPLLPITARVVCLTATPSVQLLPFYLFYASKHLSGAEQMINNELPQLYNM